MSNPRSFLHRLDIPHNLIHEFHKNLKLPHDVGLFCVGARSNALSSLINGRFVIGLNEDRSLIHVLVPSGSHFKRKTYQDGQFTYHTIYRVSNALRESKGRGLTWYVSMKRFNPNRSRLYHSSYYEEDHLEDRFDRIYGKKFRETALQYAETVKQKHQEIIDNHISQIEIDDQNEYSRQFEHVKNLKLYYSRFKSIAELGAESMCVSPSLMYRTEIVTMFARYLREQIEEPNSWPYQRRHTLADDYRTVKTFMEKDKLHLPKYAKFLFECLREQKEYVMQ